MQAHQRIAALLAGACLLFGFPSWADAGTVDLDDVDTGGTEDLEDDDARATAERARAELESARQRLERANAAYSEMRARDYPRGDARGAIVQERGTARRAYDQANARYAEILEQSP